MMMVAIKSRIPFKVNGREVRIEGDIVTVSLLGKETVRIDFAEREVTVSGGVMVTRKSARVINAVLQAYTKFRLSILASQWVIKGPDKFVAPMGPKGSTFKITAA